MNVYYQENFWGCAAARENKWKETGRAPGSKIPLNFSFSYAGEQFFIPALYRFPEGITIDVVTLPDEQKDRERMRVYEEEYACMSEEEKAVFEAQAEERLRLPIRSIMVNGKEGRLHSSCSGSWLPWQPDHYLDSIREEYADLIPEGTEFVCMRFHADVRLAEDMVESLSLYTKATEKLLPVVMRFETGVEDAPGKKLVSFNHPRTGAEHALYLCETGLFDLGNEDFNTDFKTLGISGRYALQIVFETVPPLEKGERLYLKDIHYYEKEKKNRCCTIITSIPKEEGEEDGPTSIFLGGNLRKGNRKEPRGGEYGRFLTELTVQEQRFARLAVIGIYTEDEPEQEIKITG